MPPRTPKNLYNPVKPSNLGEREAGLRPPSAPPHPCGPAPHRPGLCLPRPSRRSPVPDTAPDAAVSPPHSLPSREHPRWAPRARRRFLKPLHLRNSCQTTQQPVTQKDAGSD